MQHLASSSNWYGLLGRVVEKPMLFNTNESITFRGTGLHAIGRIFRQAAEDGFFGSGVILGLHQESGSKPVVMVSCNKSVKTADSSSAAYLRGRLDQKTISG